MRSNRLLAATLLLLTVVFAEALSAQGIWSSTQVPYFGDYALAYDEQRQRIVAFGESGTWEWDGRVWIHVASVGPSSRSDHALAYHAGRGRVVMFGGSRGGNETWEWDGLNWNLAASSGPSARWSHAMAYDAQRGHVVMFGGRDSGGTRNDTWAWNGAWTSLSVSGPQRRVDHAMGHDALRGRIVMFGGYDGSSTYFNDTWEWNGSLWSQVPTFGPSQRRSHAMAHDALRGRVVMFGGDTGSNVLNDTWEWDGSNWRLLATSGPSARHGHAMAYDTQRRNTVLFGGANRSPSSDLNDLWHWDGSAWQGIQGGIPYRYYSALAYDDRRGRVVLFGGYWGDERSDTWEWDGSDWLHIPASGPPARQGHDMAYDSRRGRTVLFGGRFLNSLGQSAYLGDTWEWDGSTWRLLATGGPSARSSHAMAYDAARARVVLVGGVSGVGQAETWEWDGSTWLQRLGSGPSARAGHAMAYDAARERIVLFGGSASGGFQSDTWEWDGGTWSQVAASGPPARTSHVMAYDVQRGRVLMFGGGDVSAQALGDTWEWDGGRWSLIATSGPLPSYLAAMAHDARRGRTVLIGTGDSATWQYVHPADLRWIQHPTNGHEYALTEPMTWTGAEAEALRLGGHLATVRSQAENAWLVQQLGTDNGWIGFQDEAQEGTWEWIGGEPSGFTNWAPGEPNNAGGEEDHAFLAPSLGGGWVDTANSWAYPRGIIERVRSPITRRLYLLTQPMSWTAAEAEAQRLGGHLATVRSQDEQNWIWSNFGSSELWIGLNDSAVEGQFVWASGEPVTYTHWNQGEPNNAFGNEDVVQLNIHAGGRWNDLDGSSPPGLRGLVELTDRGAFSIFGRGCAGSNGVPLIASPGRPTIGNASYAVDLSRALAGTPAVLLLSFGRSDLDLGAGCVIHPQAPWLMISTASNAAGGVSVPIPIPNQPAIMSGQAYLQFLVLDPRGSWPPGAPLFAFSDALMITLGY